jgi:AmpD protein
MYAMTLPIERVAHIQAIDVGLELPPARAARPPPLCENRGLAECSISALLLEPRHAHIVTSPPCDRCGGLCDHRPAHTLAEPRRPAPRDRADRRPWNLALPANSAARLSRSSSPTDRSAAHPYFASIAELRVSAHFLIRRDGELLQFVGCNDRAWHAGASSWKGRERCNDFSIGIELEGTDDLPYAAAQYTMLARLVRALRRTYPITDLVGHSDIAPGRKTDPGPAFDWGRLAWLTAPRAR